MSPDYNAVNFHGVFTLLRAAVEVKWMVGDRNVSAILPVWSGLVKSELGILPTGSFRYLYVGCFCLVGSWQPTMLKTKNCTIRSLPETTGTQWSGKLPALPSISSTDNPTHLVYH